MSWEAADHAAAEAVARCQGALSRSIVVGLAGAQGSGKSTMAPRLAALLEKRGLHTAILALDDFYLTRAERLALAETVHPLLATRGVPGTHDIGLLDRTLDAILAGNGKVAVPRFDKATDDRTSLGVLAPPLEVVLLEGWCVGAPPQPDAALIDPVNDLERIEDPRGVWRGWVNHRLATNYAALFDRLAFRVFLHAPSFAVVERWRGEQEVDLGGRGMAPGAIGRFVAHYERITRWMIADEPADLVIDLDSARIPVGTRRPTAR